MKNGLVNHVGLAARHSDKFDALNFVAQKIWVSGMAVVLKTSCHGT